MSSVSAKPRAKFHVIINGEPKALRPYCNNCGWRKGGPDSWDGVSCKCHFTEPPIEEVEDIRETNPHAALLASESYESPSDRAWAAYVRKIEKKLGHSIDGNQATDGYSLDYAYDYWINCDDVDVYVADVIAAKAEIAATKAALDAEFGPVRQ